MKTIRQLTLWLLACALLPAHAALPIQSWTLKNGARVLFVETRSIPIVDISIAFDAGSRRDPQGKSGVAALTGDMMSRGVAAAGGQPALSEAEISDRLADIAAQLEGDTGRDSSSFSLRTLSGEKVRNEAVALMARILAQPAFPQSLLEREKQRSIAAIREAQTKPASIGKKAFMRALYGSHPYARSATVESVGAINRADLESFHKRHYAADRAVIAIVGDLTRQQAESIAVSMTEPLSGTAADLPPISDVPAPRAGEERIPHPATQAHILIGMPSLKRGDPDYFALMVGNHVLGGGGFVSRLVNEVREKRGLSYSVGSSFNPMKQEGPFQIGLQTRKAQADDAIAVVRDTLETFLRDGPTEAELKAAKDNLIGGFGLRIDSNRKILNYLMLIGFHGLPLDYLDTWKGKVAGVTREEVRAAFNRKLALEKMRTVVVGAPE